MYFKVKISPFYANQISKVGYITKLKRRRPHLVHLRQFLVHTPHSYKLGYARMSMMMILLEQMQVRITLVCTVESDNSKLSFVTNFFL